MLYRVLLFFWAYLYIVLWNHLIRVHSPFMGLTHQICCFWFCYGIILYIHLQKITLTKDKLGSQKTNYDTNDYFLFWKTWWYHWYVIIVIQWKEYSLEKHLFFLAPFFIFIVCLFFAGWYKELITSNQIN